MDVRTRSRDLETRMRWLVRSATLVGTLVAAVLLGDAVARAPAVAAEPEKGPAAGEVRILEGLVHSSPGGQDLALDLALPAAESQPTPGVVCIHGGGWQAGRREDLRALIADLARCGYAAASVSYRFAPDHPWPAQLDDVRAALRWMRTEGAKHGIDPYRIAATGYSAGGHLSLMLGLRPAAEEDRIQAVVNYFGPTDMRTDVFGDTVDDILRKLLAGTREEKARAYEDASPVVHVSRGDAPVLTFQGTVDDLVPVDQARVLHAALAAAGVPNAARILEGRGHGWGGADMEDTHREALAFLDLYLRGSDLPLVAVEDFREGSGRWEATDADAWKVEAAGSRSVYALHRQSKYSPPVRSPVNYSLLRDAEVGDFQLDALVRSTTRDYPHRDLCLFFGYRDPSHYYYVHIAKAADPNAHSVFLVDGKPRTGIASERTKGADWDDGWHRVRIRRESSGPIAVFFDDFSKPIMTAKDATFPTGRIGLGSFDDTASFAEIRLRGRKVSGQTER